MVKRLLMSALMISCLVALLAGCGAEPSGGGGQSIEYRDMKQMVIDILKTEDAQKALQEQSRITGTGGFQMLSATDQENIKLAIKEVLLSPDARTVLEELMTDTRFAGEFAKAVNKENKQIHKELLKDPSYQQDLVSVFKGPEMEKVILDALSSTNYRKRIVTIMQESLQSPMIKLQMYELLRQAVREELNPKNVSGAKKQEGQEGGGESGESEGEDSGEAEAGEGDAEGS
ncbi:Spore germination protein GerD [Thermobacillus xylanilyticus]|jgi:spore germination protein D|uniref:Spore germination protein GerD n=1 Tax=Thermobacillus xylanilyticus TaxID=76633 RepID=A0ABN7SBQ8_THEXY|nr:spore germination lipoprotein GerD [Thermobacillus xylanilyticus]REJ13029.1 MAG: spore gernimation protein [Paenibacillaceae bacterium]CAG5092111.1 Spore germination protein GerD [Thermobacillus xylanilyticus]